MPKLAVVLTGFVLAGLSSGAETVRAAVDECTTTVPGPAGACSLPCEIMYVLTITVDLLLETPDTVSGYGECAGATVQCLEETPPCTHTSVLEEGNGQGTCTLVHGSYAHCRSH